MNDAQLTQTGLGVRNAWDFYLSQHDVTVPDIILCAVEEAVSKWLAAHQAELLAAIAKAIADKAGQ